LQHAAHSSSSRVNTVTQFVSQLSPPSSENACSQRGVGVATSAHVYRTMIGRPSNVSGPLKMPVSPENEPTTGGSSVPERRLSAQYIDPWLVSGSKKRNDTPT